MLRESLGGRENSEHPENFLKIFLQDIVAVAIRLSIFGVWTAKCLILWDFPSKKGFDFMLISKYNTNTFSKEA